jgi:hypothetical protein
VAVIVESCIDLRRVLVSVCGLFEDKRNTIPETVGEVRTAVQWR